MPKDSVLFRFREKDSREGITRITLKQLAAALDLSETAAIHRALAEYAKQFLPQYPRDDGPLTPARQRQIDRLVRQRHGEVTSTESLFDEPPARARKSVPPARGR